MRNAGPGLGAYAGDAPTDAELADRLGLSRDRLLSFVDTHDPTPAQLLGFACADPDLLPVARRWLAARKGGGWRAE